MCTRLFGSRLPTDQYTFAYTSLMLAVVVTGANVRKSVYTLTRQENEGISHENF